MRGVFDDEELRPAQLKRDTELTLGSGMLVALFFGLVLLCGLCFGLGYIVGHHSTQPSIAANTQPAAGAAAAASNAAKPSATVQAPQPSVPASPDADQQPAATPSDASPAPSADAQPAASQAAASPAQPAIHPALTPAVAAGQPVPSAAGAGQRAAFTPASAPQTGGLMVQIAAVSNAEDADVLTGALRKRGYVVTSRRDPADNLIHVRIGPFATQAEANTWKMKLLNDGYNAIVQP